MNQISDQALVMFMNTIIDVDQKQDELPKEKLSKPSPKRLIPIHTFHYFQDDFQLEANPGLQTFFKKILAAVELKESQYSISASYQTKENHAHIGWGISPQEGLTKYEPKTVGNEIFLWVDTLQTIEQDKNLKTRLWQCLKQIYDK